MSQEFTTAWPHEGRFLEDTELSWGKADALLPQGLLIAAVLECESGLYTIRTEAPGHHRITSKKQCPFIKQNIFHGLGTEKRTRELLNIVFPSFLQLNITLAPKIGRKQ